MELDPFSKITELAGSAARFIATQVRLAREQLAGADLNPHEGRLRASAYLTQENIPGLVPDFPPADGDSKIV